MKTSAVILAGGRGRRMGNRDKGSVIYKDKPLVEHVLYNIAPQVDQLAISANRNIDFYRQYNYPVLADDMGDFWGPLAGMATAMNFFQCEALLTVPCDTPDLPQDLAQHMLKVMRENNCDTVIAKDNERLHPVISLLKCSLYQDLHKYLQHGGRTVLEWMQSQHCCAAEFAAGSFININSEEDLE